MQSTNKHQLCLLVTGLYITFHMPVQAQDDEAVSVLNEQRLEQTVSGTDDTPDLSEIDESMRELLEHPLNLNRAGADELRASGLFTEPQISSLIHHRERFGPLIAIQEMQVITGFDTGFLRGIAPFVTTGKAIDEPNATLGRMIREGEQQVVVRMQLVPELKEGYTTFFGPPAYEGSPLGLYIRYRFRFMHKLFWGVTAEKDPGEPLFRGCNRNGFDFYSWHFAVRDAGPFRIIALGDYELEYGQGLTLSTGLSGGKPPDPIQVRKNADGIYPYNSSNESLFKRGAAISLGIYKWRIDAFGSRRRLDGNLYGDFDSIPGNEWVSSLQESGYHRTYSEISDRNALREYLYGGHAGYQGRRLQFGLTAYSATYSLPLVKNYYTYNRFEFKGKSVACAGMDYAWLWRNINFFGEIARSRNGSIAGLQGVLIGLDPRLAVTAVYRNYPRDFQNPFSGALRESGHNFNEQGIYTGCSLRLTRTLQLSCSYDYFRYPWLRYQVDAPSAGSEFSGTVTWSPTRKTSLYVRYRTSRKYTNESGDASLITTLTPLLQDGVRFHISSKITNAFTLRTRVELVHYCLQGDRQSGMVIFQDLIYQPMGHKLSGNLRYALFDTDSYDSRVYAYENDVLGGYSIPAYYYRGSRINFNLRYALSDEVEFWFRYSASFYDNRDSVGSGLDEIKGSKKSEFKWQLRFSF